MTRMKSLNETNEKFPQLTGRLIIMCFFQKFVINITNYHKRNNKGMRNLTLSSTKNEKE